MKSFFSPPHSYYTVGIITTIYIGAVFIVIEDLPYGNYIVISIIFLFTLLGFIAIGYRLIEYYASKSKKILSKITEEIIINTTKSNLVKINSQLISLIEIAELRKSNSKETHFITDGFIGLQKKCIELEGIKTDKGKSRIGIFGHLPSHMRNIDNRLTKERGDVLFQGPGVTSNQINRYVDLVNQRTQALYDFLNSGGSCIEVYYESFISRYVEGNFRFNKNMPDMPEEVRDRINGLLFFLNKFDSYKINIIPNEDKRRKGPYFFLRQDVGLIIDLRTSEIDPDRARYIDGIYTTEKKVIEEFIDKHRRLLKDGDGENELLIINQNKVKEKLNNYLEILEKR